MTEPTKSMRIRVNASRTSKGYSVDATCEILRGVEDFEAWEDVGQLLENRSLERLETVMAKLSEQYPREA